MKIRANTPSDYFAAVTGDRGRDLERVRRLVRTTLPETTESLLYGMPAYAVPQGVVAAVAAQKHHLALYVCVPEVLEAHRARLRADAKGPLDCGKGCIRFRRFDDLPLTRIRAVLRAARDRACAMTAAPPPSKPARGARTPKGKRTPKAAKPARSGRTARLATPKEPAARRAGRRASR